MGRIVWFGMGISAAGGPVVACLVLGAAAFGALGYLLGRRSAPEPPKLSDAEALREQVNRALVDHDYTIVTLA